MRARYSQHRIFTRKIAFATVRSSLNRFNHSMNPNETDELAAAGMRVVGPDDEDEDIVDEKPVKAEEKDVDGLEALVAEDEISEEEADRLDALADFMPEEDEI